ncbi:MAG: TlpA disulfide reductase family protein [Pseudomonadales bacterium]
MKKLFAVLLVIALTSCQQPDFYDTEGRGYLHEDLKGKWLILNYWATWCGPCIKEIPELNKLAEEHADTLQVFGVNFDQPDGEQIQEQVARMKIEFPVYLIDPAAALGITRPEVLPTTFVFDPQGKLHSTLVGPQTEESLLELMR